MRLELSVLGQLEARADGAIVTLPGGKHRRLLLALALGRGRACSPDALVEALWGEAPPASSRKLLQLYVSQLRKALPEDVVVTKAPGYALQLADDALDVERFERLARDARTALDGENPELAAALAGRAAALWRGPAYADAMYEEFVRAEADRLEELRLQVIEDRLEAELRLGRHESTLAAAVALAAEHPLRERPQELVMVALYRAGRQAEALDRYADFRRRLDDELGLEPSARLRELQRRILRHDPGLARPERAVVVTSALPASAGRLIGRSADLERLHRLLRSGTARLVVLTGAGGTGKTRLALEVAREAAPSYANGAVFVELAPLREAALVPSTVAQAIGLGDGMGETEDALIEALADLELLLVVDNAEHVREAAPLYARLVSRAPRVVVLVTSRAVLHVTGEHVFPVAPLAEDDAFELFDERARSLSPSFSASEAENEIREICRHLDGLPLAIELAAARIRALTPRTLLERLDERLALLTAGPRDLPARQQTLRETIDWSVHLLAPPERRVFARLSACPAGATLAAAAAVADADVDTLARLVDDHLLQRIDERGAEPRFGMLRTIREYALELLASERAGAERALGLHLADLLERAVLKGPDSAAWLPRLDAELDNVRAALDVAATLGDHELELRLTAGMWRYWWIRGALDEGIGRIEAALERSSGVAPSLALARTLAGGAGLSWARGDLARASDLARSALPVAEAVEAVNEQCAAHTVLGVVANNRGEYEAARFHHGRSVELKASLGIEPLTEKLNLGVVALDSGDFSAAVELFAEVLAAHRRDSVPEGVGLALLNLGLARYELGELAAARDCYEEAHEAFAEIGFRAHLANARLGLAGVEAAEGRFELAAELLGGAAAELDAVGWGEVFSAELAPRVQAAARAALGDEAFTRAYDAGRRDLGSAVGPRAEQAWAAPPRHRRD